MGYRARGAGSRLHHRREPHGGRRHQRLISEGHSLAYSSPICIKATRVFAKPFVTAGSQWSRVP